MVSTWQPHWVRLLRNKCERICMWYGIRSYPRSVGEMIYIANAIGAILLGQTSLKLEDNVERIPWRHCDGTYLPFNWCNTNSVVWTPCFRWFRFGAVFISNRPSNLSTCQRQVRIWFFIGAMTIIIRVLNPGYPEGMMFAILFGNMFCPTHRLLCSSVKSAKARKAVQ